MTNYNLEEFKNWINTHNHQQEAEEFQWNYFFQHVDKELIFHNPGKLVRPDTTICEKLAEIYKQERERERAK